MKAAILNHFKLHREAGDALSRLGSAAADGKLQAVLETFHGARSDSKR